LLADDVGGALVVAQTEEARLAQASVVVHSANPIRATSVGDSQAETPGD
jgi:hypothetical protein